MRRVIPIRCPYCGAQGQIAAPPEGAVLVAPCPRCSEMVLVLADVTVPLDKHIILHGTRGAREQHVAEAIVDYLVSHVGEAPEDESPAGDEDVEAMVEFEREDETTPTAPLMRPSVRPDQPRTPITDREARDFVAIDLHLIDRKDYFDRVFGGG